MQSGKRRGKDALRQTEGSQQPTPGFGADTGSLFQTQPGCQIIGIGCSRMVAWIRATIVMKIIFINSKNLY
ncbi:MAG: hypothetical protein ABI171_21685 [Collimonas sp.]|uniref:hypothetical protein n=1 Tax=Collimonas sp. TaxID=1963772 RepID=UPI003267E009